MADLRISDLPAAATAADSMQMEVNDSGVSRSVVFTVLKTWIATAFSNRTLGNLSDAKAARANLGFEKLTTCGDAAYTVLASDRTVALTAALTAPRTWTLPAASAMNPGATLRLMDQAGGISAINTLTIAAAGSDTLNGAAAAVFAAPYTDFLITTDGASKWTYDVQGLARGGTGATTAAGARTNLGLGTAAIANIGTTTGTVAAGDALAAETATRAAQTAYLLCLSM